MSWMAQYVWANEGFSGIVVAFAVGVVESTGDYITMLVQHPIQSAVYLGFLVLVGRLAWR